MEDLTIVESFDWVLRNRGKFLWIANESLQLFSRVVDDAIVVTGGPIVAMVKNRWWIVGSEKEWLVSRFAHSVEEFFSRVIAFPEMGRNCMRGDILLKAFANEVVTLSQDDVKIIKGDISEEDLQWFADLRTQNQWKRMIAFRMLNTE